MKSILKPRQFDKKSYSNMLYLNLKHASAENKSNFQAKFLLTVGGMVSFLKICNQILVELSII